MKNKSNRCLKCGFWGSLFHYCRCPFLNEDICDVYITVYMRTYDCTLPKGHEGKHIALEEAENDQNTPYQVVWCGGQRVGKNDQ